MPRKTVCKRAYATWRVRDATCQKKPKKLNWLYYFSLALFHLPSFRCSALHLPSIFNSQGKPSESDRAAMLRLISSYPLTPKKPHWICNKKLGTYYDSSSIVKYGGIGDDCICKKQLVLSVSVKAMKDEGNGGGSMSFSGQSWDPSSEIEVPSDQRPVSKCCFWL